MQPRKREDTKNTRKKRFVFFFVRPFVFS